MHAGKRILSVPLAVERDRGLVCSAMFDSDALPDRKMITAAIQRLVPMIDAYFRLWQRERRHADQNEGMRAALNAVGRGIVMVDRHGAAMFANAIAEKLLQDGGLLRRRGATLATRNLGDTMKLQAMLPPR